jgi:hypothetical protein
LCVQQQIFDKDRFINSLGTVVIVVVDAFVTGAETKILNRITVQFEKNVLIVDIHLPHENQNE